MTENVLNVEPALPRKKRFGHTLALGLSACRLLQFHVSCRNLPQTNWLCANDAIVALFVRNPDTGVFELATHTLPVEGTNCPTFPDCLEVEFLPSRHQRLKFAVYDVSSTNTCDGKDLVGVVDVDLDELVEHGRQTMNCFELKSTDVAQQHLLDEKKAMLMITLVHNRVALINSSAIVMNDAVQADLDPLPTLVGPHTVTDPINPQSLAETFPTSALYTQLLPWEQHTRKYSEPFPLHRGKRSTLSRHCDTSSCSLS